MTLGLFMFIVDWIGYEVRRLRSLVLKNSSLSRLAVKLDKVEFKKGGGSISTYEIASEYLNQMEVIAEAINDLENKNERTRKKSINC